MASNWTRHPFVVTHKSPPQLLILTPAHCSSSPAHLHPALPCQSVTMVWQQLKQHQFQRILGGQLLGLLIFENCGPPTRFCKLPKGWTAIAVMFCMLFRFCFGIQATACYRRGSGDSDRTQWKLSSLCLNFLKTQILHQTLNTLFFNIDIWNKDV